MSSSIFWAAAIFKEANGNTRHLVLWDCDRYGGKENWKPEHANELRQKDVAGHHQKTLLAHVKPAVFWLHLGTEYQGQGQ